MNDCAWWRLSVHCLTGPRPESGTTEASMAFPIPRCLQVSDLGVWTSPQGSTIPHGRRASAAACRITYESIRMQQMSYTDFEGGSMSLFRKHRSRSREKAALPVINNEAGASLAMVTHSKLLYCGVRVHVHFHEHQAIHAPVHTIPT